MDSFKTLSHLKLQCFIGESMATRKEDIVASRRARDHLFSTFKPETTSSLLSSPTAQNIEISL